MALVIAADVVVEAELAIFVAAVPVAARPDAVHEPPVMEHGQVESAAVPGYELGSVLPYPVEEALDERALAVRLGSDGPHAEGVAVAQRTRDGNHTMQVQRQKVSAARLPAQRKRHLGDLGIRQPAVESMETAQAGDVGNGFDIESQNRGHTRSSDRRHLAATRRPAIASAIDAPAGSSASRLTPHSSRIYLRIQMPLASW